MSNSNNSPASTQRSGYPEFTFIWGPSEDLIILPLPQGGFEIVEIEDLFGSEGISQGVLDWYYLLKPRAGTYRTDRPSFPRSPTSQVSLPDENPLIQLSTEGGTEIPEALQCTLCGGQTEVQFKECSHGTCGDCLTGIWQSRREHPKHLPTWLPCPFCRAEIRNISILSNQPQFGGFGDSAQNDTFTIWGWQSVLRWVARRDSNIARRLHLQNCHEFFFIRLEASGTVVVERCRLSKIVMEQPGAPPAGASWRFFVIVCFLVLGSGNGFPRN